MKEIEDTDFTNRGWVIDEIYPRGFFYPAGNEVPHLHLTSGFDLAKKRVMVYLGYKDKTKNNVAIFQKGEWNQNIVDRISEVEIKTEANFAKAYS